MKITPSIERFQNESITHPKRKTVALRVAAALLLLYGIAECHQPIFLLHFHSLFHLCPFPRQKVCGDTGTHSAFCVGYCMGGICPLRDRLHLWPLKALYLYALLHYGLWTRPRCAQKRRRDPLGKALFPYRRHACGGNPCPLLTQLADKRKFGRSKYRGLLDGDHYGSYRSGGYGLLTLGACHCLPFLPCQ